MSAVRTFYALLCKTRQRHGLPAQPFGFFANIQRHILARNQGQVVLAHHGETPVAGAVYFHFGTAAIYKFGASDESLQHLRANNLVMWEAIKWHAAHGFTHLDFGRTSLTNEGLRKFKLGWGTTERLIEYVRQDLPTGAFIIAPDEASGWYNRVFNHMPVSLSRLAGALLYKHMA
jgi:lipid II:glycine glycyltransferase (peptidoglycan interpeptide bridge formation enzyme)